MTPSPTGLRLSVNGQPHTAPAGITLATLLEALRQRPDSVATAVNGGFVARERRAATVLGDGDAITLIRPIEGG